MPARRESPTAARELEELDAVMGALAHPSRRQILLVIRFRGGSMTAGEIAERFRCRWPTVSRHLKVLESSGLVRHEKRGRHRIYRVDAAKLDAIRKWLRWFDESEPRKMKR